MSDDLISRAAALSLCDAYPYVEGVKMALQDLPAVAASQTDMDPIDRSDIDRVIAALRSVHGSDLDNKAADLINSLTEDLAETRILAAIEPQPDQQCCMCGKLGLSTAEDGGPECELHDGRWVCSSECWNNASSLAETTPPQPDPRDAVIAQLVEALETAEELYQVGLLGASPELIAAVPRLRAAALAAAKGGVA